MVSKQSPEETEAIRLWYLIDQKARMSVHSVNCPPIGHSDDAVLADHQRGSHVPYGYEALHRGVTEELHRLILQIEQIRKDHAADKTAEFWQARAEIAERQYEALKRDLTAHYQGKLDQIQKLADEDLADANRLNSELREKMAEIHKLLLAPGTGPTPEANVDRAWGIASGYIEKV